MTIAYENKNHLIKLKFKFSSPHKELIQHKKTKQNQKNNKSVKSED